MVSDFSRTMRDNFLVLLCLAALLSMLGRPITILLEPIRADLVTQAEQVAFR